MDATPVIAGERIVCALAVPWSSITGVNAEVPTIAMLQMLRNPIASERYKSTPPSQARELSASGVPRIEFQPTPNRAIPKSNTRGFIMEEMVHDWLSGRYECRARTGTAYWQA